MVLIGVRCIAIRGVHLNFERLELSRCRFDAGFLCVLIAYPNRREMSLNAR